MNEANTRAVRYSSWLPALALVAGVGGGVGLSFVHPVLGAAVAGLGGTAAVVIGNRRLRITESTVAAQAGTIESLTNAGGLRDPETNLPTAEALKAEWARQLARYQRRGERFALAVLNVADRDVPGPVSAAIASGVATELSGLVRAEDQVYRMSNATFGVLLTGTEREGAEQFLERVRRQLRLIDCGPGVESRPISVESTIVEWHDRPDGYAMSSTRSARWVADGPIEEVPSNLISRWAGQRSSARRVRFAKDSERRAS